MRKQQGRACFIAIDPYPAISGYYRRQDMGPLIALKLYTKSTIVIMVGTTPQE
ncbi:hypothetical protein GGQ82_003734 [Sphingobium olei]